jgi:hypothetical protein
MKSIETIKHLCELAGTEYVGMQEFPEREDFIIFNHPITHSSLSLKMSEINLENIISELREHEKLYGITMGVK